MTAFASGRLLKEFNGAAPVTDLEIDRFEVAADFDLPKDYLEFLRDSNGGEGFIGPAYVIFWPLGELLEANTAYHVEEYAPGLFIFGSNGGGEAFAFDMRTSVRPIVMAPFIGMELSVAEVIAPTFKLFLEALAGSDPQMADPIDPRMTCDGRPDGMEIFEIHPVILGGSPTDPANKTALKRAQHIQAVRYWNEVIRKIRKPS